MSNRVSSIKYQPRGAMREMTELKLVMKIETNEWTYEERKE
jgi:hypothetical protein